MGRTLLGVDLDESHVGGLVKRLLTDEELEKLADGGRPADGGDEHDGSAASGDEDHTEDDGDDTADGGDGRDETDDSGSSSETDDESDSSGTDVGSGGTGGSSVGIGSTDPTGSAGSVGDVDESEFGFDDPDWDPVDEDESEGRLGGHGPLILKGGAVLLVLVVVALVVWRYGGKIKGALPFVGGSDSEESDEADEFVDSGVDDVSPARRRAKVGAREDADTESPLGGDDSTDDGTEADERAETDVRSVGEDVDLGALVGLGALALIAAVVRKYGEDRQYDPLVDGPEE